jgi:hypothetical protein
MGKSVVAQNCRYPRGKVNGHNADTARTTCPLIPGTASSATRVGHTGRRRKTIIPPTALPTTAAAAVGPVLPVTVDGASATTSEPTTIPQRRELRNPKSDTTKSCPSPLRQTWAGADRTSAAATAAGVIRRAISKLALSTCIPKPTRGAGRLQ